MLILSTDELHDKITEESFELLLGLQHKTGHA